LIILLLLAIFAAASSDSLFGSVAKRTYGDARFPEMYRRQTGDCDSQCGSIEAALGCNSTECACPIFASAGSTAVTACVNCLQPVAPLTASNITLFANVCSMCQSQCSTSLTAYIQTLSCNNTACECTLYLGVGSAALTTCATCVETFDPTDAAGLLAFAQACGVNVTVPSASQSSASQSSTSLPSASKASATIISTPSATSQVSSATSSATAAITATGSTACRVGVELFGKLFWSSMVIGLLVSTLLVLV
jgi:hypothetical protein